jgi:shikimate kinase
MPYLLLFRGAMGSGKTTVARALQGSPGIVLIEIDEIKLKKYQTTEYREPAIDFREAGAEARKAMDAGNNAIVIEPLCVCHHIDFVLAGARLSGDMSHVLSVWLDCALETSLSRKGQQHRRDVIEGQHRRYADRCKLKNEFVIATDETPVDQVARQLLEILQQRQASSN